MTVKNMRIKLAQRLSVERAVLIEYDVRRNAGGLEVRVGVFGDGAPKKRWRHLDALE